MVSTYDGEEEKQSEMTEIMSGAAGILVVILTGKKKKIFEREAGEYKKRENIIRLEGPCERNTTPFAFLDLGLIFMSLSSANLAEI